MTNGSEIDAVVAARVWAAVGAEPRTWTSLAHRGYTYTGRWIVHLADGRSTFVKAAVDQQTAAWLRAEYRVYAAIHPPFLPRVVGWSDDGELPVLLLEDLQDAHWPPPWTPAHVDAVRRLLRDVAATTPPCGLGTLEDNRAALQGWRDVEADPAPFLHLGLCTRGWLASCLPALRAAADAAPLDGDALVHGDVRSDNICIRDGRAMLVDWNWAVAGNPLFDLVSWLPSLHAEGGPPPEQILPGGAREITALIAGYFAARAGLPIIPEAPRVRQVQLAQLRTALPWAARALGLPPPVP